MARDICPLSSDDIPELSQFLTAGFHTPVDADYAAPEVLRWKYLEARPADNTEIENTTCIAPHSYLARDETGKIIGHLGLCRSAFEGRGIASNDGRASTIHVIDWLGSPTHRALGISLLRKAHEGVATQFSLGGSQLALAVGERTGYETRTLVPVYVRVLCAGYWMRSKGSSLVPRGLRIARDVATRLIWPPAAPRATIQLKHVVEFSSEIGPIIERAQAHAILTQRNPERLNAMLRFPRQKITGWHLLDATGRLRGIALLNVISTDQGRTKTGKIVDCLLDDIAIELWHAATLALTRELAHQGADLAQAFASTPWMVEALRQSGYESRFAVKFILRDRQALIPREAIFHLTPIEGDHAYT